MTLLREAYDINKKLFKNVDILGNFIDNHDVERIFFKLKN